MALGGLKFTIEKTGEEKTLAGHLSVPAMADFVAASDNITVRELLNHESGVARDFFSDTEAVFFPGQKGQMEYSNFGFKLLARIVEHETKTPFTQHIQSMLAGIEIFEHPNRVPPDRMAATTGYDFSEAGLSPVPSEKTNEHTADGMGCWYMDAPNLTKFLTTLHSGGLVQKSTMDLIVNAAMNFIPNGSQTVSYASAFNIENTNEGVVFKHDGARNGKGSAAISVVRNDGSVINIVMVSNSNSPVRLGELLSISKGDPPEEVVKSLRARQSFSVLSSKIEGELIAEIKLGDFSGAMSRMKEYVSKEVATRAPYDPKARDKFGTSLFENLALDQVSKNAEVATYALELLCDSRNKYPDFAKRPVAKAIRGLTDGLGAGMPLELAAKATTMLDKIEGRI